MKKSSDFNFTVTSRFLENVLVKPYFNSQCPIPTVPTVLREATFPITTIMTFGRIRTNRQKGESSSPLALLGLFWHVVLELLHPGFEF